MVQEREEGEEKGRGGTVPHPGGGKEKDTDSSQKREEEGEQVLSEGTGLFLLFWLG